MSHICFSSHYNPDAPYNYFVPAIWQVLSSTAILGMKNEFISELYQQKKTPSSTRQSQRFNEEDALYSCHGEDTTKRKKNILLGMTASAGLSPVAIIDDEGREENLLAHDVVASRICDNKRRTVTIKRTGGSKSFYDGSYKNGLCCPLSLSKQNNRPGLSPILSSCPFKKILHTRTFIELNDDMCKKLNDDWELYPQLKFFYARALTGSIIVNNNDNTAALINMVEVYGRNKSVDAHHERYMDNSKTGIQVSTLPPVVTKYKNFWATTTIQDNSVKLHFASKTFNALVTSSYRMDGKHEAEVGLSTTSFRLDNMSTFRNAATSQIYIDLASWNKALTVLKEKKSGTISARYCYRAVQYFQKRLGCAPPKPVARLQSSLPVTTNSVQSL
ncbi:hypothetical protein HPULCUR_009066 [Helicostylum pulchrum]|uniref:Uncharacterized protein n=1 Tax=Helicostylum pulchrum TaxID=562976 RepID=A0ABP9Y9M4_9FUNG